MHVVRPPLIYNPSCLVRHTPHLGSLPLTLSLASKSLSHISSFVFSFLNIYAFFCVNSNLIQRWKRRGDISLFLEASFWWAVKAEESCLEREGESGRGKEENCCMSVDCIETYLGGIGELANPLQWPQLRKRRRLLLRVVPLQVTLLPFAAGLLLRRLPWCRMRC